MARLRFCRPAQGKQRITEVGVSFRVIRPQAQRLSAIRLCLRRLAAGTQQMGEIIVSVAEVRPDQAEITQGVAEIAVAVLMGAVQCDGPTNVVKRQVIAPHVKGNDAQQMQSIGMGGRNRQNLAIRCLGLLQPVGAMIEETMSK